MKLPEDIIETIAAVLARPDVYPIPDSLRQVATDWLLTGCICDNDRVFPYHLGTTISGPKPMEGRGYTFLVMISSWWTPEAYNWQWGSVSLIEEMARQIRADLKVFEKP